MVKQNSLKSLSLTTALLLAGWAHQGDAAQVRVTVTNLALQAGTFLTPVWLGFHDGGFDLYNLNEPSSPYLERVAEDGNTAPVTAAFTAAGYSAQTTLVSGGAIPVFAPGTSNSAVFDLDPTENRYFSFLSMVIPSNDAFFGNGNPIGHEIFDANGSFVGHDFVVTGLNVRDAGTEVNDELPLNTAFLGQATPDTGVAENGVITVHPGFLPNGNILTNAQFANANFTQPGYQLARIQVSAVPIPAAAPMLLSGLGVLGAMVGSRRRSRS